MTKALTLIVCSLFSSHHLSADAPVAQVAAPHIVIMIADDLGIDAAPCHNSHLLMPELESRCATSLVFERAYAHPYCTASRASLMTGRHTFRHGANDVRETSSKLPLAEVTLPEFIRAHSDEPYQFGAFGKWHLADDHNGSAHNPNLQGFDHFAGTPRQHHTYRYTNYEWVVNGESRGTVEKYKTSQIVDEAVSYLGHDNTTSAKAPAGDGHDQPKLLFLNFVNPHRPYHLPPKHLYDASGLIDPELKPSRNDNPGPSEFRVNQREPRFDPVYRAMLGALDTEISRFTQTAIRQSSRPFLFVFIGDNGSAAEVYLGPEAQSYRAKASLYDGGVRVPIQVWSSDNALYPVNADRVSQLVHLSDLFATMANVAGVAATSRIFPEDSVSFAHLINPDQPHTTQGLARNSNPVSKTRQHVYLERGNARQAYAFGVVDATGAKLILRDLDRVSRYAGDSKLEYYDTQQDPSESNNLLTNCNADFSRARALLAVATELHATEASANIFDGAAYHHRLQQLEDHCQAMQAKGL